MAPTDPTALATVQDAQCETDPRRGTLLGMNTVLRRAATMTAAVAALGLLASCATPRDDAAPGAVPPPKFGDVAPAPPEGDVLATGTVMDKPLDGGGRSVELCLGAIAESYPPQCGGIPLEGWDWEAVDGEETASDHTWGAYAVTGRYDGEVFTVTADPILLALFDPMMAEDPTGGLPGETPEAELQRIQETVTERLADEPGMQGAYTMDGYVWLEVLWDDGTYQDAADAEFGEGIVIVQPLLKPVAP